MAEWGNKGVFLRNWRRLKQFFARNIWQKLILRNIHRNWYSVQFWHIFICVIFGHFIRILNRTRENALDQYCTNPDRKSTFWGYYIQILKRKINDDIQWWYFGRRHFKLSLIIKQLIRRNNVSSLSVKLSLIPDESGKYSLDCKIHFYCVLS